MTKIEELKETIALWEQSIGYISGTFDDIEEYIYDVYQREEVDRILGEFGSKSDVPTEMLDKLNYLDELFIQHTRDSDLCIHDLNPKCYVDHRNTVQFRELVTYDKSTHWYNFRWHLEDSTPLNYKNSIELQRECYGLDFENMSLEELKAQARKLHFEMLSFYQRKK